MTKTLLPLHRPPVQHSTGWRCDCHLCGTARDGFATKRGARRALVRHLRQEHRQEIT